MLWHSSLTQKKKNDLERVQKSALKLILKERYKNYEDALNVIEMDSLEMRRAKLCLKFAKSCLRNKIVTDMFPMNKKDHAMDKRQNEKFDIRKARTERLQKSAVMHMQRLLNNEEIKQKKIMRAINNIMPVNYRVSHKKLHLVCYGPPNKV